MSERITSIKDPRIVEARELNSAAGRARLHKCLLEGSEIIKWAGGAGWKIEHVFYSETHDGNHPSFVLMRRAGIPCYEVSDGILKKISDTSYLVPAIGVARIPDEMRIGQNDLQGMGDFVVIMDRVQDHGNIGTIIRTASAFGIRDIVSTTPTLDIYYKKIITASRGRSFDMRIRRYSSGAEAINALQHQGYQIIATSSHARDIQSMAPLEAHPIALVVGNETEGVAEDILKAADIVVQIPMSGQVESLNVGVATGISLYELKFRMVLTMLVNYIRSNMGREVNITGRLIQQAFDAQIRAVSDLSGQQAILLMMLICDQSMTLEQVTRDTGTLGEERATLLQPLFDKGYIRHQLDNENIIIPTEDAQRVLAQLWTVVERAEQAVLNGFSDSEKQQFRQFLARIQENCRIITSQAE